MGVLEIHAITQYRRLLDKTKLPSTQVMLVTTGNFEIEYCIYKQYFSAPTCPRGQHSPGASHGAGLRADRISQPS